MLLAVVAPIVAAAASPVPIDDLGGILVVPVTVNGKGPFHFILDTGAGITVITPQLAKTLALTTTQGGQIGGMGQAQLTMQQVTLDRVGFGDVERTGIETAIVPLPRTLTYQGAYGTIDGILGYTFFKDYVLTFDVANKWAEMISPAAFKAPDGVGPLPLTFAENRVPLVDLDVAGARGVFELDSGSNGVVIVSQDFARAHDVGKGYENGHTSQYTGVGGSVGTLQVRVPQVTIGDTVLHELAVDVSSANAGVLARDHLDGTIGHDVLSRFAVTVDYPGSRVWMEPAADYDRYRARVGTGITPERDAAGNFHVIVVASDTPAASAGVVAGDTIVAVNGRPASELSLGDYANATGTTPGSTVTYTIASASGARRDVPLRTIDLVPASR